MSNFQKKVFDLAAKLFNDHPEIKVIVFDSVASMIPKVEMTASLEDQQMASLARVLSKGMRKLTQANKNNALLIFINQIRENPGAGMYGCVHGDTSVHFKDGRKVKMKDVVEKKLSGDVLSLNEKSGIFEYRKVINWYKNGNVKSNNDFIHILAEGIETTNGTVGFTLTPEHLVLTQRGWVKASDLLLEDSLVSSYKNMQGLMKEILYSIASGDSHIVIRSKSTGALKLQDSENPAYVKWKIGLLSSGILFHKNSNGYVSTPSHDLKLLKDEVGRLRNPLPFLEKHFSRLGFAIWIMDDGHFDKRGSYHLSIKRLKQFPDMLLQISLLVKKYGYQNSILRDGSLLFNRNVSLRLARDICHYVPKCMEYKLPNELRNQYKEFNLRFTSQTIPAYIRILSIGSASNSQMKMKGKYDLEIEGTHNYMIGSHSNGIVVHNSTKRK